MGEENKEETFDYETVCYVCSIDITIKMQGGKLYDGLFCCKDCPDNLWEHASYNEPQTDMQRGGMKNDENTLQADIR